MAKLSLVMWSREIGSTKTFPLKIRINDNGKISYTNLGFAIHKKDWNPKSKLVKESCKDFFNIYEKYEEELSKLRNKHGEVDDKKIKHLFTKQDTVHIYYKEYLIWKSEKYSYSTYSTNLYVFDLVKKYVSDEHTSIHKINRDWIEKFHEFLSDKNKVGKEYSINTIHAYFFSFVAFIKWVNKKKKMDIEIAFSKYTCEKPQKNPKYNTHLDLYKEVVHNMDYFKRLKPIAYIHMARYILSVSFLGIRSSDLALMKLSNFKTKVSFSNICVDEDNDEYEHVIKKEIECSYYMQKNKRTKISWILNDSSFKYLVYFLDSDLQRKYANKFNHCIISRIIGDIDDDIWNDEDSYKNLKILYEYSENNFFKRTYEYNDDEELENTASLEIFDDSEKIEYAKELFQEQLKRVKNDVSKDRYLTGHVRNDVDYEKSTDKYKFELRNAMCAIHANSIKLICKKFNIKYFHPHTARHTFAMLTILSANKNKIPVDIVVLQNALGHMSIKTTEVYLSVMKGEYVSDAVAPALTTL